MIQNIDGKTIQVNYVDEKFELPLEIKKKIEEFWNQCKLENPHLWNGVVICVDEYKREKDNKLDVEFQKIHFIKRGTTTEELNALENPKRNYLEILLETDSKIL